MGRGVPFDPTTRLPTGAKSCRSRYDFGDSWTHSIEIERPVIGLAEPMLHEATGRCPSEEIGGPSDCDLCRMLIASP